MITTCTKLGCRAIARHSVTIIKVQGTPLEDVMDSTLATQSYSKHCRTTSCENSLIITMRLLRREARAARMHPCSALVTIVASLSHKQKFQSYHHTLMQDAN